jgi:hypothetical protein
VDNFGTRCSVGPFLFFSGGSRPHALPYFTGGSRPHALPYFTGGSRPHALPYFTGGSRPHALPYFTGGSRPCSSLFYGWVPPTCSSRVGPAQGWVPPTFFPILRVGPAHMLFPLYLVSRFISHTRCRTYYI